MLATIVAGSTAFQVAKTPGRVPVWSAVRRGSNGTRKNTKPGSPQKNGPSPQSRATTNGVYGVNCAIGLVAPKLAPPSVDRTTDIPAWLPGFGKSPERQET